MRVEVAESGFSEAACTARYFLVTMREFSPTDYVATVDVGGGTTDITFFKDKQLQWEDSVKFAGTDILEIASDMREVVAQESYDQAMRQWPYVSANWDGKMADLHNAQYASRTFRTFGLFFGSICYYLGLHLRAKNIPKALSQVAFAGNGTGFLRILTSGNDLTKTTLHGWVPLMTACIAAGHGLGEESYRTDLFFTPEPKQEVAKGLVSLDDEQAPANSTFKILGLQVTKKESVYLADTWPPLTGEQLAGYDIDAAGLRAFLEVYNKSADRHLKDLKIRTRDDIDFKQVQNRVRNTLHRRGNSEPANPVFLEAVKAIMELVY